MQNETNQPEEQYDPTVIVLPHAPLGLRFANYLIDSIVNFVGFFIVAMILVILSLALDIPFMNFFYGDDILSKVHQYIFLLIVYVSIYTITETASKGRTLGKLITGTKAVKEDGSPLTKKDAFIRSLCRMIPFEALSAFSDQFWHDRISKTAVIVIRK
jgi:uncharacterized RDD family membrane protein YckC